MAHNPLRELNHFGQSVWPDCIRRDYVTGGGLAQLILEAAREAA